MSIPFSQSLRALRQDHTGRGRWLALAGVLLLAGWLAWFLWAEIPIYETSDAVTLLSHTEAEAWFLPEAAAGIQPGQAARLRLENDVRAQPASMPATVTAVSAASSNGSIRVHLALHSLPETEVRLSPAQSASVEIIVTRLSPAQLFLRAAGPAR